jgi:UDP-glucuronate decarboxylase
VVSNFIVQALLGRDITIYGDGVQRRAFCYVDDLIDGLVRLMQSPDEVTGPINLGNPQEITMRELAAIVIDLTGSRSKLIHRPLAKDDPQRRCPDISKARQILKWEPRTPLLQGVEKTIRYFDDLLKVAEVRDVLTADG